jgi:hypothetical protein
MESGEQRALARFEVAEFLKERLTQRRNGAT